MDYGSGAFRPLSAAEFEFWKAWERVCGPLEPLRGDYRAALVSLATNSPHVDKDKHTPTFQEWILRFEDDEEVEIDPKSLSALNVTLGGEDQRVK